MDIEAQSEYDNNKELQRLLTEAINSDSRVIEIDNPCYYCSNGINIDFNKDIKDLFMCASCVHKEYMSSMGWY